MLISGMLLYQCDPCLISDQAQQHYLTMLLAAVLFMIGPWRKGLRADTTSQADASIRSGFGSDLSNDLNNEPSDDSDDNSRSND
jgi:hypothetical protein